MNKCSQVLGNSKYTAKPIGLITQDDQHRICLNFHILTFLKLKLLSLILHPINCFPDLATCIVFSATIGIKLQDGGIQLDTGRIAE